MFYNYNVKDKLYGWVAQLAEGSHSKQEDPGLSSSQAMILFSVTFGDLSPQLGQGTSVWAFHSSKLIGENVRKLTLWLGSYHIYSAIKLGFFPSRMTPNI